MGNESSLCVGNVVRTPQDGTKYAYGIVYAVQQFNSFNGESDSYSRVCIIYFDGSGDDLIPEWDVEFVAKDMNHYLIHNRELYANQTLNTADWSKG